MTAVAPPARGALQFGLLCALVGVAVGGVAVHSAIGDGWQLLPICAAIDRASFLEEQKALHDAWKTDADALLKGQNTTLRQVVVDTAAALRAQGPGLGSRSTAVGSPQRLTAPARPDTLFRGDGSRREC